MDLKQLDHYLIGEAWTSTQAYAHLEKLCDLAPRFSGSPGNFAARDLILGRFRQYGLGQPHAESFDYLTWTRGRCELELLEPLRRMLNSAISLVYSPDADHLRGHVVDCGIGSEQDFGKAGSLKGKIAMVTTANPENRPAIHRREKYGRAVAAGAVGFLYVNHKPGLLAETGSLRPGKLAEIPAIALCYEEGWQVARHCKRGPVQVAMTIRNETRPGQGYHVVGVVEGQTDETIVVGAHYDGHDISQGAMDDATGTVLILELARILAPLKGQFKRTIRLIAFDAEELGVLGSQEYVRARRDDLTNLALMINLDGAAGPVASHGFLTSGLDDTKSVLQAYARDFGYPLTFKDHVMTASDNFPFFMQGIPAICMVARPDNSALGRGFGHTAADTLDKVAETDLKSSAMTIARMLARLANHDGALGARRSREEIKQILVKQDLEKALRAQEKWPF
ncbi:MAG: M28 family peptidase [Chloroflexi bacterium]|nr:M28 family peptidase [Chloroflexota bacterium]